MSHFVRNLFVALLVWFAVPLAGGPLGAYAISTKPNVDFTVAKTDEKIGSFLVLNPTLVAPTVFLVFANGCNIEHFRRTDLSIPITSLRLMVNDTLQDLPRLWTRAAADCGTITWSPPGPTYSSSYVIDILASWAQSGNRVAGTYSESLNLTAFIIP